MGEEPLIMKLIYAVFVLILVGSALAMRPAGPSPFKKRERKVSRQSQEWLENYARSLGRIAEMAAKNATVAKILKEHFETFNQEPDTSAMSDFQCDLPPSSSIPANAHTLRPGDIKAIGGVGDSITAGFGITAEDITEMLRNDRRQAFASGGIESLRQGMITTPNVLRIFNPNIRGFSSAESWAGELEAGLNVAIGGAIATDMPDNAYDLVYQMWYYGEDLGVDWYEDWKLVSFLIGGNDLCRFCNDPEYYSAESFVANIRDSLDYLYTEGPPKMIVALSTIFDVTPLPAFSDNIGCDIFQSVACPCAYDPAYHPMIQQAQKDYHNGLVALIESGRYDTADRPDFTVVLMPHFKDALPPKIPGTDQVDASFWAVDCFHPGKKAHFAMTVSLWNQLFEPEGQKRTELDWSLDGFTCPTEQNPFIQTRVNGLNAKKMAVDEQGMNGASIVGGSAFMTFCVLVGAIIGVKLY